MNNVIIETERLLLRQHNMNDIDDMVEGLNNINVTKWLAGVPYPYTRNDAENYINTKHGVACGGIWTNENYQGHGYGSEAFGAVIKYAFEVLGLRRLENGYFKDNEKSRRMQLRFGYKEEGFRRQ